MKTFTDQDIELLIEVFEAYKNKIQVEDALNYTIKSTEALNLKLHLFELMMKSNRDEK
jgi:hypothetical protein